jgi:CBS domain-containing protein
MNPSSIGGRPAFGRASGPSASEVERVRRRRESALRRRQERLRKVVGGAHEVRLDFLDERILFAHVLPNGQPSNDLRDGTGAGPPEDNPSFTVRPWGSSTPIDIPFDDIVRAVPVRRMNWLTQRQICADQSRTPGKPDATHTPGGLASISRPRSRGGLVMKKHGSDQAAGSQPVSSIMHREFAVVHDSLDIESLTKFLLRRNLTCAAVSNDRGILVGYVSMIDLVRERFMNGETAEDLPASEELRHANGGELRRGFHLDALPRARTRDIMMPFVLRLPESAPIDQAAAVMAAEGVHRVLIVSDTDEAVGIVSALDVLRWVAERDGYAVPESSQGQWRASCEYATT